MLQLQLWLLQKVLLYSQCNITLILKLTELSWFICGSVAELRSEILFLGSPIYALPAKCDCFFLKFVTCESLLMVGKKVPVNNLQKTELLLFCIFKSLKARDLSQHIWFPAAEWWNTIGLLSIDSASPSPSLFLSGSCLLWYKHSSYKNNQRLSSFFLSLGRGGLFCSLPWIRILKEELGRPSPFPGASARQ